MVMPATASPARRPAAATAVEHRPFTLAHFRAWAALLTFDDESPVTVEPWEAEFLEDVFAGTPEVWLVVPEGNGKTTIVALLALYHAEFRAMASVPVAASSREQAEVLYRQAEGFVLRDGSPLHQTVHSDLQAAKGKQKTEVPRFTCLEGYRRVNHARGGRIQVFAADDGTGDGVIPTLAILDELHRHRSLSLYRTWVGKLRKRGGQVVTISTAGDPFGEFEQTRDRIRQQAREVVRRGSHVRAASPGVVMHEWALAEGADPDDMRAVKACNPLAAITEASLRDKHDSPTMTPGHWLRFTCNRPTRSSQSAVTEAEWEAARTGPVPEGEHVVLGLDVAWKLDTTAAVPLWCPPGAPRVLGDPEVLVPPRDGSSLDPALVEAALRRLHARNPVDIVVMDTSRAEQLASWIESEMGVPVVDWPQTNPQAVQEYDRFMGGLRSGQLRHAGHPDLTQHVMNAVAVQLPGGDTKFDRPSQSRGAGQERRVIDALKAAAMVNCHASAPAAAPAPKPWVIVR